MEVMPFGKYRDHPLKEVPTSYLNWLLDNADLFEHTREAVEDELAERRCRDLEAEAEAYLEAHAGGTVPAEHRDLLERVLEAGFLVLAKQTRKEDKEGRRKLITARRWALRTLLERGERM